MKTNNGMPGHAAKCVAELNAEIEVRQKEAAQLAGARDALLELYGGEAEPPPAVVDLNGRPVKNKPAAAPATEPRHGISCAPAGETGKTPGSGRQPSAETVKLTSVMRTAPEPFTVASLLVASGNVMDKAAVGRVLHRYAEQGLLSRVGRSEYKRTGTFPAETPAE